ncbi:MAG: hypothetical protein ABS81_03580 [Pseudonocardia sp. SCN 72-86]|nr:MAG: hypothetical protein ABS81_03580 [Pseudonocardia sp. SCN 72-86]
MPISPSPLRPEIASAWRRAELCGLDPGRVPSESDLADVTRDTPLLAAARPVLDRAVSRLADTRFSLLLADRESRIVDRRFGHPSLARALDDVLAVPGNRYSEDTCGTNALSTAFEIRSGIAVHGEEHFFERLKGFTCYGSPIVNPVTGRLEGVLDVTGFARDATPMMATFVTLVVAGIEERLSLGQGLTRQHMLAVFQERAARTRNPVLVFGNGMTLANDAATERLDGAAQAVLRELGRRAGDHGTGRALLPSGATVGFVCASVPGTGDACVVEVLPDDDVPRPAPSRRARPARPTEVDPTRLARLRAARASVLVSGEPGTGRTTVVTELAAGRPVRTLDAADLDPADLDTIAATPEDALLVVDHVHLLPDAAARRLATAVDDAPTLWFAFVCGPEGNLTPEQRALTGRCTERIALTPLRLRRPEVPALATELLQESRPGVRLAADATRALMAWHWPGNLRELRAVLDTASDICRDATVRAPDLGLAVAGRPLTPLEQAEFDTIRGALDRHDGNKSRAATELGIGRTTLYRRLREFGLAD